MIPAKPKAVFDDKDNEELALSTQLITLKVDKDDRFESCPIVTPIYHSTIYRVKKLSDMQDQLQKGSIYRRLASPNSVEVEMIINQMERGAGTIMFASGCAAIANTLQCFLKPGDHVVLPFPTYAGMLAITENFFARYNIEWSYAKGGTIENYRNAVKPNTKILYGETPCNPTMTILDLEAFGKLGKELCILTMVDGTLASPINQTPLKYGIDMSIHSCTKYMGGHSDVLAGCCTVRTSEQYKQLLDWRTCFGPCLSPFEQSFLLRSLRTLHLRMMAHNENGVKVAEYLKAHPKVVDVLYCGLKTHPDHELAKRVMKGFGGMMTLILPTKEAAQVFVESCRVFNLAGSLGCVKSLVEHISTMTHGDWTMTEEERREIGVLPGMVRLSIGIEDYNDQIEDLRQALEKIPVEHLNGLAITDNGVIKNIMKLYNKLPRS